MLGTYDWCNMPHTRPQEYPRVNSSFELQYVEVIHRHHKRTPYAANTFPVESYPWYCDDEGLFYYGAPLPTAGTNQSANTYWSVYTSSSNPLAPQGFNGTCQFPQITRGGLDDSHQHGVDLASVYIDMLNFIPKTYNSSLVSYRVTNNVITSQVAAMVIAGMYPTEAHRNIPLLIQPASVDSLEPAYSCPSGSTLFSTITATTPGPWQNHLQASVPLFSTLDSISGVPSTSADWHKSWDHYFDNLSSRLCHSKPLPCNISNPSICIAQAQANEVFRLGQWEYSYMYRDHPLSLQASISSYGIWIAELAQNIRHVVDASAYSSVKGKGGEEVRYRHNIAHDGSLSRVLSVLQVERMVWPGMGSEVVFEVYKKVDSREGEGKGQGKREESKEEFFVRVLWGGQVLRSSVPMFGSMDMVPVDSLLGYFDALVGVGGSKIRKMCYS